MPDREPNWGDDESGRTAEGEAKWWDSAKQSEPLGDPEPRVVRVPIRDQDTVILDRQPGWSDTGEPGGTLGRQSELAEPAVSETPESSRLPTLHEALERVRVNQARVDSVSAALAAAREVVVRTEEELVAAQALAESQERDLEIAFVHAMTDRGLGYMKPHDVEGVITMDNVPVIRSDGTIEDGWKAQLQGDHIVCTKHIDGDDSQKEISIEDWFEAPKRIGEAHRPTFDRLVEAYPSVWEVAGADAYQASSAYIRDRDTGGYRVGQVRISMNNNLAILMYPHDTSVDKTVLQYISIPTFVRWQQEGEVARLAQGELS